MAVLTKESLKTLISLTKESIAEVSTKVDTNTSDIATLNGDSTTVGSVDYKVAAAGTSASTALSSEVTRATAAEQANTDAINAEVTRAKAAEDLKINSSEKGAKSGVAPLDENGLVSSEFLPSFVDDVIDVYATYTKSDAGALTDITLYSDSAKTTKVTGESGKIYVDVEGGYQFRWTGTVWATIGAPTVIGEVTGTAYDGKKGADTTASLNSHIANTSNPHSVTKAQVGLGNVDNTSDANKPVSTAQATAIAEAKKAGTDAQSAVEAEVTRAKAAEATNASNITSGDSATLTSAKEYTDTIATNASAALNTEVTRAKAAEATNATAISTETTRATTAETELDTRITNIETWATIA